MFDTGLLAACALSLTAAACSSDSASPAQRFGTILVESNTTAEPSERAVGAFYRVESDSSTGRCYIAEELGACRVWQCDEYAASTTLITSALSAGSVSVSGTTAPLSLEESEAGSYSWDNTLNAALWAGGERLLARVAGSQEFPAMSVALTAPDPVTAKAPVIPAEGWSVDSSKDLGFAWSATESDVYVAVSVSIASAEGGGSLLYPGIDCAFQGKLGTSVIPAATLQKVAKPAGGDGHLIEMLTFSAEAVRVDDAILDFRATSFALSGLAQIE